ncbi:hypothetical protein [Prosthecobacter sp.]|uniref:hypothetical protein n=1 Tax=Prosthecobacter sp. TaxID=1965333 RepID=UPI00248A1057|nr:hypothetical protein [Prosthecobacter sp.]MDI1313015.1 hypothetical protein [Prosthecobacter sp.]
MKSTFRILIAATFALGAKWLVAQVATTGEKKTGIEVRLAQALKLYPEADADKNGALSVEEALKYLEAHPELKALLASKSKSKGANTSQPGEFTTPAALGLPAGPRVFVCAHSFMIFTASMLPKMVEAAGIGYEDAGRQMIGGSRTLQHWEMPDENNLAKKALRGGSVDVLTVSPHMLLPDEGIDNFTKLGLEKNPKLRVLVQASWPARDGNLTGEFHNAMRNDATLESLRKLHDMQREQWLKQLEAQVTALNAAVGKEAVCIVPVTDAVFALRERVIEGKAPGITKQADLFKDDLGHPMPALSVLVTYCHFGAIYQRTPVGLPVPAALKDVPQAAELNALLQELAWDAVTHYPMSGVKAVALR